MDQIVYLCPRFDHPNNALLLDTHEPQLYEPVHGELPAAQYTDAATRFPAGVLLSALLCEPRVTLAKKKHVLPERPPPLLCQFRREKAENHHLSAWEWQAAASFGDTP
jgi:hypothetical protein